MHIIRAMTAITCSDRFARIRILLMAVIATGLFVLIFQSELGIPVMIKACFRPVVVRVASVTFLAKNTPVNIIGLMATDTTTGCLLLIGVLAMAGLASCRFMLAG